MEIYKNGLDRVYLRNGKPFRIAHKSPVLAVKTYTVYTVREGDTLRSISLENYGSVKYWHLLAKYNNIIDPLSLLNYIGTKIKLLNIDELNTYL